MSTKFSIKDMMSEKSKHGSVTHFEINNIALEKIIPSEINKYGIRDIEELAASIEEMGLLHNLVVKTANEDGQFEIVSGERRYRACKLLFENGNEQFKYLPCKVEKAASDVMMELKLIHANSTARILTDAEKIYQAGRINKILYKLKEEGYEFAGRMRTLVAELLNISDAQAGRMIKMDNDLIDEVKEELQAGNLGITDGYEVSKLSKDEQMAVVEKLKETGRIQKRPSQNIQKNIPTKEQETIKKVIERAGIKFYSDDGSMRDPAEFGQEIFKYLGLVE